MKKLYPYDKFINEGVRDQMTPKHEDDIRASLNKKGAKNKIEIGIQMEWMDVIKDGVEQWKKRPDSILDYERSNFVSTAINHGRIDIVDYLLDSGFHPNTERILDFIWAKKFDVLKHLMDKGVNMNGLKYKLLTILNHGEEWEEFGRILLNKYPALKQEVEKEVEIMLRSAEKYKKFL